MSLYLVSADGSDALDPAAGWGDVPVADRPLWSRYMVDHLPWFPGVTMMNFVAPGVINGGTRAPKIWKETAQELHRAGFTPSTYYLLAELLKSPRFRDELDEAKHGHLFESWLDTHTHFGVFRLAASKWKPWLARIENGESPRRALEHRLKEGELPPLGTISNASTGEVTHLTND